MTRAVRRELVALLVLSVGFAVFTQVVALGDVRGLDERVMLALRGLWAPDLLPLFRAIAMLGGVEVTTVLGVGLAVYLWRGGFHDEAWALLGLPLVIVVELVYKRLLVHPEPLPQHPDGPSLIQLVGGAHLVSGNSYPSGHVMRAVLVYGLLAFVVYRLSPPGWLRRLAIPVAAVIISAMAFDRVYLAVHWESDVIGGLLAGGLLLAAAITWLDRPRVAR